MDEQAFRRAVEHSLEQLKVALYDAEEAGGYEVEERGGALQMAFDDPAGVFVISPNAPVQQVWISALSTSFKLDWSESAKDFVFAKTGEALKLLVSRLISEQSGKVIRLA
jgi:iron donor protein CyaY